MNKAALLLGIIALTGAAIYFTSSSKFGVDSGVDSAVFEFSAFRREHNKVYGTQNEAAYRLAVFKSNLDAINKHNADPTQTYTLGVNEFTDMTFEEFKQYYLSEDPEDAVNTDTGMADFYFGNGFEQPKVDWREKGVVGEPKNQARCGSCWAFAAVSVVEQQYALAGKSILVSEQELVDCSHNYGNQGCNGGLAPQALAYVLYHKINLDKDYPYKAVTQKCNLPKKGEVKIAKFNVLRSGPQSLIDRLQVGTSTVSFSVQSDFMSYKSGVYNPTSCPNPRNHAVNAVGYDKSGPVPYFIVRNSWGTTWGDKGYFNIAIRDGNGTCWITGEGRSSNVELPK